MTNGIDTRINDICRQWQKRYERFGRIFPDKDKTIQDPIHGAIDIERELVYILDCVMMQRLRRVSQLGFANQVFPGANHSRMEHSLGVMHLAGRMLQKIRREVSLTDNDVAEAKAAALLHDVGHLPYSHVPESILETQKDIKNESQQKNVKPSELLTYKIVQSDYMKEIFEVINKKSSRFHFDTDNVANLAIGNAAKTEPKNRFLGEISHANFDADRMDYLMRDAHYTGVPLGTLDPDRLLRAATTSTGLGGNKHLAVDIKGLHSLESMIVARSMMYSVVYFHHCVRAADGMLLRAAYSAFKTDPLAMLGHDDGSLMQYLDNISQTEPLTAMLRSRILFKPAIRMRKTDAADQSALMDFVNEANIDTIISHEESISKTVSDDKQMHCMLDLPKIEIYSEIHADIKESTNGVDKVDPLRNHSKIAKGVEDDSDLKWRGYVFGRSDELSAVHKASLEYLGSLGLRFTLP